MKDPFDEFVELAFRVEALPFYADDQTGVSVELANFLKTNSVPDNHNTEWASLVEQAVKRGAKVCRLRIVSDPLSPYEMFELHAGYNAGRKAGEQIRVVPKQQCSPLKDYWLYDNQTIEILNYSPLGVFLGSTVRKPSREELNLAANHLRVFSTGLSPEEYLKSVSRQV